MKVKKKSAFSSLKKKAQGKVVCANYYDGLKKFSEEKISGAKYFRKLLGKIVENAFNENNE